MPTMKEKMTETVEDLRGFIKRVCEGNATAEEVAVLPAVVNGLVYTLGYAVIEEPK